MTDAAATIEVPSTTPPEEVAWQLALMDLGGNAALFGAVVWALWKWLQRVISRQEDAADRRETQAVEDRKLMQAAQAEDRKAMLAASLAAAAAATDFTKAIHRVELAVVKSDEHMQGAISGIKAEVEHLKTHHGGRLDQHHDRLTSIEHTIGSSQSGVRRIGRDMTQ